MSDNKGEEKITIMQCEVIDDISECLECQAQYGDVLFAQGRWFFTRIPIPSLEEIEALEAGHEDQVSDS